MSEQKECCGIGIDGGTVWLIALCFIPYFGWLLAAFIISYVVFHGIGALWKKLFPARKSTPITPTDFQQAAYYFGYKDAELIKKAYNLGHRDYQAVAEWLRKEKI